LFRVSSEKCQCRYQEQGSFRVSSEKCQCRYQEQGSFRVSSEKCQCRYQERGAFRASLEKYRFPILELLFEECLEWSCRYRAYQKFLAL
jgi:hypothetical protein